MRRVHVLGALAALTIMGAAHAEQGTQAAFPLRISEDQRHLATEAGDRVFLQGDTAWSLIAELTREETDRYLADRKHRGFNALLVNLIEHQFSSDPPRNAYGDAPFPATGAFRDLDDQYFRHAAWVLKRAEEQGFVVFLVPAYLGVAGSEQGWYRDFTQAGDATLFAYGRAIAERFADRRNLVWVHGGDFDVPRGQESGIRAVVEGIRTVSPGSIHTMHASRDTVPSAVWGGEDWLSLDTVYTYDDVFSRTAAQVGSVPPRPVIVLESIYENEHDATEASLRRQAYGALLAGGAGYFFGNNPIWHFASSGIFGYQQTWQAALDSPGARSMNHLQPLLAELPWWQLSPGADCPQLTAGTGALIGCGADGSLAVGYVYATDVVVVSAPGTSGPGLSYRWYDPTDGTWFGEPVAVDPDGPAVRARVPAVLNAGGLPDWVIVVRR